MVGVATKQTPFKLVLTFAFHVRYDHSQHLFMNVDSRYPVRHNFPPGGSGERAASSLSRVTGYRRSHKRGETTPNYSLNHALLVGRETSLHFLWPEWHVDDIPQQDCPARNRGD